MAAPSARLPHTTISSADVGRKFTKIWGRLSGLVPNASHLSANDRNPYAFHQRLSSLRTPTTNLGPPRSTHAQRALRCRCFCPCTRARNAPTLSRHAVSNIRWHTACADFCMTKTVASLPSLRWVRSIWADQGRRATISVALNLREDSAYLAGHGANQRTLGATSFTVAPSVLRHRAWFCLGNPRSTRHRTVLRLRWR